MGWVLPTKRGKVLGCEHNRLRRIEYRFTGKDPHSFRYLLDHPQQRVAQAGDEIVFLCPFGCEEISILVANRNENRGRDD